MAKITLKNDYTPKIYALVEKDFEKILGKAVYEGAGIAADTVRESINSIPPLSGSAADGTMRGITRKQRDGLNAGLGVSTMENENGYINVKIGFAGYNSQASKKYPKGEPNAMIARTIESGSSISTKTPFVAPAIRKIKKTVIAKMQNVLDDEFEKAMK